MVEAAVESFLTHGYRASRMDAIGDAAGVSYATLYKYFPSKELLFEAVVDHVLTQLYEFWKTQIPPDDTEVAVGLKSIALAYIDLVSDQRLVNLTRVVIAQARNFPQLGQKLWYEIRARYTDRTDAWLHERARRGELVIKDVKRARAELIAMLADAFFTPQFFIPDKVPTNTEARAIVKSAIRTFLCRYGPDSSS